MDMKSFVHEMKKNISFYYLRNRICPSVYTEPYFPKYLFLSP